MPIKLINMGKTSSGKTTALASLCGAGYKVRLIDLDNGTPALIDILTGPKSIYPKDSINNLRWKTFTEPMRILGGMIVPKGATVWQRAVNMLPDWKGDSCWRDGQVITCEDKLGDVATWGQDCVLAVDTLNTLGIAAMNFHLQMNGALGKKRSSFEWQRDIGATQSLMDTFFQLINDTSLRCNVVLNTHMMDGDENGNNIRDPEYDGPVYLYPTAIGRSISIGGKSFVKYFNDLLLTKEEGSEKRIYTKGVPYAGLKSSAPSKVAQSYSTKDGLAKYFEAIQGALQAAAPIEASPK